MRFASLMLALVAFTAAAQPTADEVYAEGKALYDAKQYEGALEKFDRCAHLEPTRARWQYNRGLALRKLKRDEESRAAFLESLRLDPTYKSKEIRDKLGDLAPPAQSARSLRPGAEAAPPPPPAAEGSDGDGLLCLGGGCGLVGLALFFLFGIKRDKPGAAPAGDQRARPAGPMPDAVRAELEARVAAVGARLTRVEHAMSLGEDGQARANLDRAHTNFQQARRTLAGGKNVPDEVRGALERAEEAGQHAERRLRALHGDAVDGARGPAAGCFFCARPLPTPESRQLLSLQVRGQQTPVAACGTCARRAATGDAPAVRLVNGQHWAATPGIDPYVLAYSNVAPLQESPAWQLTRQGADVGQLAGLAGAAAVGAVAGAAVARLLDVDALSESAAASAATAAAAQSASGRRSEKSWQDHS